MVFDVAAAGAEHDLGFGNVGEYLVRIVMAVVRERLKSLFMQEAIAGIGAEVGLGLVVVERAVEGLALKKSGPRHARAEVAVAAIIAAAGERVHVVQGQEAKGIEELKGTE